MTIRCIVQESACNSISEETCPYYERECEPGSYCIATGEFVINGTARRTFANCFKTDDCPGTDQCVSTRNDGHNYCCCKESLCNKIYKILPKNPSDEKTPTTTKSRTTTIGTNSADKISSTDNYALMICLSVGLLLSLLIMFLLIRYYRNKKKANDLRDFLPRDEQQQQLSEYLLSDNNPFILNQQAAQQLTTQSVSNNNNTSTSIDNTQRPYVMAPGSDEKQFDAEQIALIEKISHGHLSSVWKGKLKENADGSLMAVKIFPTYEKQSWQNEKEIYSYLTEAEFILKYIGSSTYENVSNGLKEYWLLTEFQPFGSLYDYLKENTLSWSDTCNFTLSILDGLAYLHSEIKRVDVIVKPSIAHRDLKSKNILVKPNGTCCIADFGLALILKSGKTNSAENMLMRSQVGTRRYMPPELLEGAIKFTKDDLMRIDVYSCALVLWEIISRGNFHSEPPNAYVLPYEREVGVNPSIDQMQELVAQENKRPIIKQEWMQYPNMQCILQTIEECWDIDVEARISSECAVSRLKKFLTMTYKDSL